MSRNRLSFFLDKTVTLQRASITKDAGGGTVRTFSNVSGATSIKAAIWPVQSAIRDAYTVRQITVTHTVCTDGSIGAVTGDRFLYGTTYYRVQGVRLTSNDAMAWEAPCEHDVEEVR